MTTPKTQVRPAIAEVLEAAANLCAQEGGWYPKHDDGAPACFCAYTAITHVDPKACSRGGAVDVFAQHIGGETSQDIWRWNDDPSRTQSEVVTALRDAANKSREASRG